MSIKTFLIEKKDLEGGLVHPPGTLLLKLSGREAVRASIRSLLDVLGLSPGEVSSLYRFENPFSWFLVPVSGRTREKLLGKLFGGDATIRVEVTSIEEEKTRITLHWVSPAINEKKIQQIFESFSEEGSKVEVSRITGTDKWMSWVRVKKDTALPHYIQLRYEGDPKTYKVLVTVPGRRQQCWHCGQEEHWTNQCPTRRTAPTSGVPPKEAQTSKSYAGAVKEKNTPKNIDIVTQKGKAVVDGGEKDKEIGKKKEAVSEKEVWQAWSNRKKNKRVRSGEQARSAPASPKKSRGKRAHSLSSTEDLFEVSQLEGEEVVKSPKSVEQEKKELMFPDSPTVLMIDEGEDPKTQELALQT